jgi:hypothetical protein
MRNNARNPRELESRALDARIDYTPPSALPDPFPQPDWAFRWVATHVLGAADPANASKKFREGWEPVRAEDHPELTQFATEKGNVEIGGLVLCKMPKEKAEARNAYYAQQSRRQLETVDNNLMRQNDERMPLFNKRSTQVSRGTRFGSGN